MSYYPDYASRDVVLPYSPWYVPMPYYYPTPPPTETYVTEYSEPVSESRTIVESYDIKDSGSGGMCPCSPRTCCWIMAGLLGLLLPLAILLGVLLPTLLNQDTGVPGSTGALCGGTACPSNSRCQFNSGVYTCACNSGYNKTTTGLCNFVGFPSTTNYCATYTPCLNGGTCQNVGQTFICTCLISHTGTTCQTVRTSCFSTTCQNGGTCVTLDDNTFKCNCTTEWLGSTCEVRFDPCLVNPCLNGGTCVDFAYASVLCTCADGYAGYRCENALPQAGKK